MAKNSPARNCRRTPQPYAPSLTFFCKSMPKIERKKNNMIDTVVLTLDSSQFTIQGLDQFSPSARGVFFEPYYALPPNGYLQCIQNPSRQDLKNGIYKPRLTLTKRKGKDGSFDIKLRIEFSIPKLIFGNNFDEVVDQHFAEVVQALHLKLKEMGVLIEKKTLILAQISSVHYSKNVVLNNYDTCSMIMNDLKKCNLNQKLDLNKTDYRNEGHAIRYHANSYEVVFYDKIKDLTQSKISERRAIESQNSLQAKLLEKFRFKKGLEVLRMEVRLNKRAKIKKLFQLLNIPTELTFLDLYKESVSKKVIAHFWECISKELTLLSLSREKPEEIMNYLYSKHGPLKPGKALKWLGGLLLLNSVGMKGMRASMAKIPSYTWQRLKKEISKISIRDSVHYSRIKDYENLLLAFVPVRMEAYTI